MARLEWAREVTGWFGSVLAPRVAMILGYVIRGFVSWIMLGERVGFARWFWISICLVILPVTLFTC